MQEAPVDELYRPLFFYIKKRINHHEDAEDLTQEVFFKLSKSYNTNLESVKSWLYTIARNSITDYYKKKKITTSEIEETPHIEKTDEQSAVIELSTCVTQFINRLPEDYRVIMILSELEEIPQKEIADRLGINYVTARSRIQRGRKQLRTIFSECCAITQGGKGSFMAYESKRNQCNTSKC